MKSSIVALNFCRARTSPICALDGRFLGTATAVSTSELLTCNHCVTSLEIVEGRPIRAGGAQTGRLITSARFSSSDLALLRGENRNLAYFTISSEEIQCGDEVLIYGYRLRNGSITDVVYNSTIDSISERPLGGGSLPKRVCGFQKRELTEPGMSGGVVIHLRTFEMIGCLIGYDYLMNQGRKDDICIVLSAAVAVEEGLMRRLIFSHQRSASLLNRARRAMSLAGYTAESKHLGTDPDLNECLVCTHGKGVLTASVLLSVATAKQMSDADELIVLREKLSRLMRSLDFAPDKVLILIPNDIPRDANATSFAITIDELVEAADIGRFEVFTPGANGLVGGRFLPRSIVRQASSNPESAIDAMNSAVMEGISLIIITGPRNSGKKALVDQYSRLTNEESDTSSTMLEFLRLSLWNNGQEVILPRARAAGRSVVVLEDYDELWTRSGVMAASRTLGMMLVQSKRAESVRSTIVLMSGGVEHVETALTAALPDIASERIRILELLPFSAEVVREALRFELGASEGERYWKIIASSQEIFQIAQWPDGLSILLDRAVLAYWSGSATLNQVKLIEGLVNGFLSRCVAGVTPAARYNFLLSLASEVHRTQNLSIPIDNARLIFAQAAPETHVIHTIEDTDLLVPGLVTMSWDREEVGFENALFLHYFLALAIRASITTAELSSKSLLYQRRLPVALLRDVAGLKIRESDVWKLLSACKKGLDVGFIGGNCVSLLRILRADFQAANFVDCDLRGGIFAECDLTNANFAGAVLVDAGFADATLNHTVFASADLSRADLKEGCTIYQLRTAGKKVFVATSSRRLVQVENIGDCWNVSNIEGFSDSVFSVAVEESQELLIAGGQDGTIRGFDCVSKEPKFLLRGHFSDIRTLAFVENLVVSGSVDGRINVWAPWSARLLRSISICGGQIWSLDIVQNRIIAALCDQGHLHFISLTSQTEISRHAIPSNYNRRLWLNRERNQVLVGGDGFVWRMFVERPDTEVIEVPHPSVRVVYQTECDDFLLGGAYGMIVASDRAFSRFQICRDGSDYVVDFTPWSTGIVLGGDAVGSLFQLEKSAAHGWRERSVCNLRARRQVYACDADFRGAKGIPEERQARLHEAGALVYRK